MAGLKCQVGHFYGYSLQGNVLGPTRWLQDRHSLTGGRCIHKMKRPKVRH
jgi:hypothetical protein